MLTFVRAPFRMGRRAAPERDGRRHAGRAGRTGLRAL